MKILIIGAGKMGLSIILAWRGSEINSIDLDIVEKNKIRRRELKKIFSKELVIENVPKKWKGDLLVFAIKPQSFNKVAKDILKNQVTTKSVLSIMAGIKVNTISDKLKIKSTSNIVRVMPNIAAEIGLSASSVYYSRNINIRTLNQIKGLIKVLGNIYIVKSEKMLDVVTAITGIGPAYFFLFLLAFEKIASEMGFSKKISKLLVFDTVRGALELAKDQGNIRNLIESVASKGGTTSEALKVLEKKKSGLYKILKKAIVAANKKAIQLSKN